MHAVPEARPLEAGAQRSGALVAFVPAIVGTALVALAFAAFLLSSRDFNAGRGDFFYLADALLHGRTWLLHPLGPWDDVIVGNRVFVPFAPFPAVVLMPLVAVVGPETADKWQPVVNSLLAAACVGLVYWLAARIGVRSLWQRVALALLFGFSTQIWWVTTRGGVWHTGHLVASVLTLLALLELFGKRRMDLVGLAGGAAFLTRAPVLFALPFYGLWALVGSTPAGVFTARFDRLAAVRARGREALARLGALPWRDWFLLALGVLPSLLFSFLYNAVRFGSPLESGYGLASLPPFLETQRQVGLFSLAHLPMNLDYLLWHLPKLIPDFPFFRPDGLGMSIFITSPGLLLAAFAPWRDRRTWLLAAAFLFTLLPSLLYYGGGWLQYGYRYALDSIPFAIALCGMALASRRRLPIWLAVAWLVLVGVGLLVGAAGVYWAFHL